RVTYISNLARNIDERNESRLFVRLMAEAEPRVLGGSEKLGRAFSTPFFSPDGEWIGFWSDASLKKIAITGGAVLTICDADVPQGVSWEGNEIVFGQGSKGIMRVS